MEETPHDKLPVLDYAAPERWRWDVWIRVGLRLTPVWSIIIVMIGYALDGEPERVPWRIAESLSVATGAISFWRRDRWSCLICIATYILLLLAAPEFDRAR